MSLLIITPKGTLDLLKGAEREFYITRQIHDLHNFETRNADFSKTISVPPTPNNIDILDSYTSDPSYVKNIIPCQIILGGITIASRAKLLFTKTTRSNNETSFEVQVLYGNFNLFDDILTGDISELNWADLAFDMTYTFYASQSLNTTDLATPIVDWLARNSQEMYYPTPRRMDVNMAGFFLYVKEVVRRIVDEAGYEVVYLPGIPDDFYQLAIACPVSQFYEIVDTDQVPINQQQVKNADRTVNNVMERISFDTGSSLLWSTITDEWTVNFNGPLNVSVRGTYDHTVTGIRPASIIRIMHEGAEVAQVGVNGNVNDVSFYISASINVLDGDTIWAEMESLVIQSTLTVKLDSSFQIATPGVGPDRTVQPSEWVPKINKSQFIADMLKLFNLVMRTDDITNQVFIQSFNDVYTGAEQDLTVLLDVGQNDIEWKNSINSLGQYSRFSWENDNLFRRDSIYTLTFDNQLLAKDKDVISMEYSACDLSTYLYFSQFGPLTAKIPSVFIEETAVLGNTIDVDVNGNYTTLEEVELFPGQFMILWKGGLLYYHRVLTVDSSFEGTIQTPISTSVIGDPSVQLRAIKQGNVENPAPRLALLADAGTSAEGIEVADGTLSIDGVGGENKTPFPIGAMRATFPDSLGWESITSTYYKNILDAFQSPQVIQAWFNLPVAVFNELDFMRPIYIKEFNAFYYLNKIEQFKLDNKTRLELVRISIID